MNTHPTLHAPAIGATRYELKAVADRALLPQARMWLRLHPACFHPAFPPRQVNSIYFDTTDLDSYAENLAGVSERRKVRLRWYGAACRDVAAVFEVKCKRNKLGWKLAQPIEPRLDLENMSWREVLAVLHCTLAPEMRLYLAGDTAAVALLRYQREYYESFDGSARITLDYGLAAYEQRHSGWPNLRRSTPIADNLVVEFKTTAAHSEALEAVINSAPFRLTASSKYVAGVAGLLGL